MFVSQKPPVAFRIAQERNIFWMALRSLRIASRPQSRSLEKTPSTMQLSSSSMK
jgi:hypothetical protein